MVLRPRVWHFLVDLVTALVATLLLCVGWAVWHIPLFLYRPGYTGMGVAGIVGWLFSLVTGAVLLTSMYNSSRGSLLVVAIFHATVDVAFTSTIASPMTVNVLCAFITVWGVVVVMVAGPRFLSRSGSRAVADWGKTPEMFPPFGANR